MIGGSLGLSDAVLKRADYKLSFARMTFPASIDADDSVGTNLQGISDYES